MTSIAFLGLGIMGSRMAANLAGAGHELRVWNRTSSTADAVAAEIGARAAATPAEAADGAELVFTIVVDGPQVSSVLLGKDGAASGAAPGTRFVDCSTIGPAASLEIAGELRERGFDGLVDAPVTGGKAGAQDGTLTFMVGASPDALEQIRPALEAMGRLVVHCGDQGRGQLVKVISNTVGAANTIVAGQALLVARRAGVDLDALVEAMANGTAASRSLEINGPAMRDHDYAPRFKLAHMLKDVTLCLQESQSLGVPFPAGADAHEMLIAGVARGHGDDDTSAVVEALQALAAVEL